ncbi:peptide ABC transporter substrate-binding protein [Lagierella sp. ICN-221743]
MKSDKDKKDFNLEDTDKIDFTEINRRFREEQELLNNPDLHDEREEYKRNNSDSYYEREEYKRNNSYQENRNYRYVRDRTKKKKNKSERNPFLFFRNSLLVIVVLIFAVWTIANNRSLNKKLADLGKDNQTKIVKEKNNKTNQTKKASKTKTKEISPSNGTYLNSYMDEEPNTLDAQSQSDGYGKKILINISEPLLRMGEKKDGTYEILPAAAEKYEVSDDGLVYTFHLREGMEWEDGMPLTAKDYEYGIKRANKLNETSEAEESSINKIRAKAVDDLTLKITLKSPANYFPNFVTGNTAMLPCRKDLVKKYGNKYGKEANKVLSCGPFKISEWTHDSKITLVKNEDYWDKDNVHVETVNIPIINDKEKLMESFSVGVIDEIVANEYRWQVRFKEMEEVNYRDIADYRISYYALNHEDEFLKNNKIRLALSLEKYPEPGMIPDGIELNGTDYRKYAGNVYEELRRENKKPKDLFVEGLRELGKYEDPAMADITLIGTPSNKRSMELSQKFFNDYLGTNIKIETMEWPILLSRVRKGDYQLAKLGWMPGYNDPSAMFTGFMSTENDFNTNWKSYRYDELVRNAIKAKNSYEALEYYKEAEQILANEAVIIPTSHGGISTRCYQDFVKGVTFNQFTTTGFKTIDTSARK